MNGSKKVNSKRGKYIKILDRASVVVGVIGLTIGIVRKVISPEDKPKK